MLMQRYSDQQVPLNSKIHNSLRHQNPPSPFLGDSADHHFCKGGFSHANATLFGSASSAKQHNYIRDIEDTELRRERTGGNIKSSLPPRFLCDLCASVVEILQCHLLRTGGKHEIYCNCIHRTSSG